MGEATADQKRLVRYAEAMGFGRTCVVRGEFNACRDGTGWTPWNPLTDANDALKLAEKMNVLFERSPDFTYWAEIDGEGASADTLPAAICAAVDAALERER